jgi:hypothetical protein
VRLVPPGWPTITSFLIALSSRESIRRILCQNFIAIQMGSAKRYNGIYLIAQL